MHSAMLCMFCQRTYVMCLPPAGAGVQVFTCPSTGALVAVEVDVLLDSSTAPDSVHLQLLARGPIGKYGFHLESARVQGERHPPGHAFMLRQADMLSLQEQQQLDGPAEGCRTVTGCRAVHTGSLLEAIMHASKRVSMHESTPMLLSPCCVLVWCCMPTGHMRLVPVPEHGQLLVQYTQPPTVEVELSTAYPAMLPHNRAKLLQVDEIAEMLQDTLQGGAVRTAKGRSHALWIPGFVAQTPMMSCTAW